MSLIFERIQTPGLAELSYLIGDDKPGIAAVIDPFTGDSLFVGSAGRPDLLGAPDILRRRPRSSPVCWPFLSPFVLVFAISVVFLVHSWVPGAGKPGATRRVENLSIPAGFEQLQGREQVEAAHTVLESIAIRGEIGFVRQFPKERRFVFPVSVPGRETIVDLNFEKRSAEISARTTGVWDALVFLHKMPGPHNVNIRGNSTFMHAWRWLVDATVYLLMFLSVSGIYLWAVLRSERRVGIALRSAGAITFGGLVYAVAA